MAREIETKCIHLEEEENSINHYGAISFHKPSAIKSSPTSFRQYTISTAMIEDGNTIPNRLI